MRVSQICLRSRAWSRGVQGGLNATRRTGHTEALLIIAGGAVSRLCMAAGIVSVAKLGRGAIVTIEGAVVTGRMLRLPVSVVTVRLLSLAVSVEGMAVVTGRMLKRPVSAGDAVMISVTVSSFRCPSSTQLPPELGI